MTDFVDELVAIDGARTRILRGGPARAPSGGAAGAPAVVFLHGGTPGKSLYCGGAHMWRPALPFFAAERPVVAVDLPGCGGSEVGAPDAFGIDGMGRRVLGVIRRLGLDACHVVGTDIGGLVALWLAMEAPEALSSITIVASHVATPTGDSQENLVLAHPPRPLWTRESQAWVLDRMSWSHHHIDAALLDGCTENARGEAHLAACRLVDDGAYEARFLPSVAAAKGRFYQVTRERGLQVPTQIVWAANDPLSRLENGMTLFRIVAEKQRISQFHVLARVGALPFHEEPEAFHATVAAFQGALVEAA